MYKGRLMELGATADVFRNPRHPYMRLLEELIPTCRPTRSPRPPPRS